MSKDNQPTTYDPSLGSVVEDLQMLVRRLSKMVSSPAPATTAPASEHDELAEQAPRQHFCDLAKREYAERARRFSVLDGDLFGEPAWDILLDLFISDFEQRKVSVTSACIASNVPTSTGLRWIRLLEQRGLIERIGDAADGRRSWIQITAGGRSLMDKLLAERVSAGSRRIFQFRQ